MNANGVATAVRNAKHEKGLGNEAFSRRERAQAVTHYTEAIEYLHDAAAQQPTDEEKSNIQGTMAVCFANRAAAWLLPGEGQDPQKALDDASAAVEHDAGYAKG